MPVKHLIRQAEEHRANRTQRDIRPAWMTELIEEVAGLFEPLSGVGRVGYDCQLTDERWEVNLYLGRAERVGGAKDGEAEPTNFQFHLLGIVNAFTMLHSLTWHAFPNGGTAEPLPESFLMAVGEVDREPLCLRIHSIPPDELGPGLKIHQDGRFETV